MFTKNKSTAATKFHGRKAAPCKRCGGVEHHVNRMGGIVCSVCSPVADPDNVLGRLTIEGGVWIDPADRFSWAETGPAAGSPATSPAASDTTSCSFAGGSSAALATSPAAFPAAFEAAPARSPAASPVPKNKPSPTHPRLRGPQGELSEFECELFVSDRIWQSSGFDKNSSGDFAGNDVWIVLKDRSPNPGSLEWLGPNTAVLGRVGVKRRSIDTSSPHDIACRGALRDPRSTVDAPHQQTREVMLPNTAGSKPPGTSSAETERRAWIGEIVRVTGRTETFRGTLNSTMEYLVSSVFRDSYGRLLANLSDQQGTLIVSGIALEKLQQV